MTDVAPPNLATNYSIQELTWEYMPDAGLLIRDQVDSRFTFLDRSKKWQSWGAISSERKLLGVGCVNYGDEQLPAADYDLDPAITATLGYLAVQQPYQRKLRIGSTLLARAEEAAAAQGMQYMLLESVDSVEDFYLKNGYKRRPRKDGLVFTSPIGLIKSIARH